jgi:superfamily II DNA helicase RecQ
LKKHAVKSFWEWVSSWAVCLRNPIDLGYSAEGYMLPKLNTVEHILGVSEIDESFTDGFVRKIETSATSFHKEKRHTADDRARKVAEIVSQNNEQYLVWCNTDYEADLLRKYIPDALEVRGSNKIEFKEQSAVDFVDGKIRVLISKPKIFGFGLNFQNCRNTVFCGLDYSYEGYYQAIRRLWRYGQMKEVNCHIVLGSTEKHILETIRRKETQQNEMHAEMYSAITEIQKKKFKGHAFKLNLEAPKITVPSWVRSENGIHNRQVQPL